MQTDNFLPKGTILKGNAYKYCIEKVLGQGTFGITYLASVKMTGPLGTIDTNIKVAIKEFFMRAFNGRSGTTVTTGSTSDLYDYYKSKFAREATNLSKMKHPNIVKVLELFRQNDTIYYSMEYIDGGSLNDYIGNKLRLSESEAVQAIIQIGKAISFMHSKGMLHLDLKPQNIMRRSDGNYILIDFGLSKQYDENGNPESKTEVGKGTQGYAPIEQAYYQDGNEFPVTMDIYALGGTLFKMLTGVRPPEASIILNDGFPYDEIERYSISADLKNCVAHAMAPRKKDRYQTVQEFIDAMEMKDTDIKEVYYENRAGNKDHKFPNEYYIQPDTSVVEILYIPGSWSKEDSFCIHITYNAVYVLWDFDPESTSEYIRLTQEEYTLFLERLQALKLKIRKETKEEEDSEDPNKLTITLYDKNGTIYNKFNIDEWHGGNIDDNGVKDYFSYLKKRIIQIIPENSNFLNKIVISDIKNKANSGNKVSQCELGFRYYHGDGVIQNYKEAVKWFTMAAEQGDAAAQGSLGACYYKGEGVIQNYKEAVKWFTKSAKQGYAAAQCSLGACYYKGEGAIQNYKEAVKWLTKSAGQGYATSQGNLGFCYYKGEGVIQNYEEAVKWFTMAAEQGNPAAQYNLGACYYKGEGVIQNYKEAVKWFTKSAKQGYAAAQGNLGFCYYKGEGVIQNYKEAVKWLTKSAEQGDATSQGNLGFCYYKGEGVIQNYEEAVKWFTMAAEQGNPAAQYTLGACYYKGEGVMQNYKEAVKWFTMAAEQGYAAAQYGLGTHYYKGEGVIQNYKEAVRWNTMAAEQGYAAAQYILGAYYYKGEGVIQNYEEAVKWLTMAAEQGYTKAQYVLGIRYYNGEGIEKDYKKAFELYSLAAEKGYNYAIGAIGKMYFDGIYVVKDYNKAFKLLKQCAENRELPYPKSMRLLASCYHQGLGTEIDLKKEEYWIKEAAKYEQQRPNTINGHEYVDLGLSVKWATCNVGAEKPSDYGDYFAWGETSTKSEYIEESSVTWGENMGDIVGHPLYDTAHANCGGTWRLPTAEEIKELINKCKTKWTTYNGHKGRMVTGPNGNSIFLPAAGWRNGSSLYDVDGLGLYWSSTPYEDGTQDAYGIDFGSIGFYSDWNARHYGLTVRPVTE